MQQIKTNAMPYNLEAEQSVLGSILIDMEYQYEIMSKLKECDFYLESHKLIFDSMFTIINKNSTIDLVTLSDAMERSATLEKAGGIDYLTVLARITPSAANYEYYLDVSKQYELMPETKTLVQGLKESFEWYVGNKDKVTQKPFFEYIENNLIK